MKPNKHMDWRALIRIRQMNEDDPNIIAAELADDVRAAAGSLGQSPQAALEHRLGWRAINTYRPNPNGRLYIKDNRLILPGDEPPARPQGTSHGQ